MKADPEADAADRVIRRASEVIRPARKAEDWLLAPCEQLGGATPYALAQTKAGEARVLRLLAAMEYGMGR